MDAGRDRLAYAGLRVLDLSQGLAGPYCAMLLAQHGADVIKVEPAGGDWSRGIGMRHGEHSALHLAANRGKRSLAIDLKHPDGVRAVRRIARASDVVIESFRPGVAERLGLGARQLCADDPRLVYLSVSGFGQSGPLAQRPGTDTVVQGYAGVMSVNRGADGQPAKVGMLVVDTVTALYAFQAVAAALYARRDSGRGAVLDVSLMQGAAAFLAPKIVEASLEGEAPVALNVPAGVYRTSDGRIAISLSKEAHFAALCRATGCEDLLADPRYASFERRAAHAAALVARIGAAIAGGTSAHWLQRLEAHDVLVSPVNTLTDWLGDAHALAVDAAPAVRAAGVGSFRLPRIPGVPAPSPDEPRAAWPGVGTDNEAVLADCGFTAQEIAALQREGVLLRTRQEETPR